MVECCFTSTETVGLLGREPRTATSTFTQLQIVVLGVLLYVHRNRRLIRDGRPRTATSTFTQLQIVVLGVLLYVHRNRRLIRDGSQGRPPRLSHSSCAPCKQQRWPLLTHADGYKMFRWNSLRNGAQQSGY